MAAAAATMAAMGLAAIGAAGAATHPARRALVHPQVLSGTRLWLSRYNGDGGDRSESVAASPRGDRVFVTGGSYVGYVTVAYHAATGARLWVKRYNGPGSGPQYARAVAVGVSPNGARVFVTGGSCLDFGNECGFATVAYDAMTGAQLWVQRYNGPDNSDDSAGALSVARDGSKVFVAGWSSRPGWESAATVAYDAATGAQLWVSRYTGGQGNDIANAVISPGGNRVYVTGSTLVGGQASYLTVAYNATTGTQQWLRWYSPRGSWDYASSLAASPDRSRIFVTGSSNTSPEGNYATVAYNAATGAQLWARHYNGPGNRHDDAKAVAVARDGSKVFVTGSSYGGGSYEYGYDYATVAYSADTGTQLWVRRYNGPGKSYDAASSVVSPGNGKVYVTGESYGGIATGRDYATVAYSTGTGTQLWVRRYNGPGNGKDEATSLAMSPDRARLYVTGASTGATSDFDYATIAYQG